MPSKTTKKKTMETQQNSQNEDEFDKLRLKNAELKKNLEREQLLHTMLYKEWVQLKEQISAKELEVYDRKPKNVFYKYAFYLLLVSFIPSYYFLYGRKTYEKSYSSPITASAVKLTADSLKKNLISKENIRIEDSTLMHDSTLTTYKRQTNTSALMQQSAPQQTVVKPENKIAIQPDTNIQKTTAFKRPVVEPILNDSMRDIIYWQGWNAYYNKSRNTFKKSSEKYKVWLQGWDDGKNDAQKLSAKNALKIQK